MSLPCESPSPLAGRELPLRECVTTGHPLPDLALRGLLSLCQEGKARGEEMERPGLLGTTCADEPLGRAAACRRREHTYSETAPKPPVKAVPGDHSKVPAGEVWMSSGARAWELVPGFPAAESYVGGQGAGSVVFLKTPSPSRGLGATLSKTRPLSDALPSFSLNPYQQQRRRRRRDTRLGVRNYILTPAN